MKQVTPIGALLRGFAAGAVGSYVQTLFFKWTSKVAPSVSQDVFTPPEPQQKEEMPTHTIARRVVEGLAQRGPLSSERKARAGNLVHFGFGATWGGLYGLVRESAPAVSGLAGAVGFGTLVWAVGDEVIVPAFKLSAWPPSYPVRAHAFWWAAHLAYGLSTWGAYEILRRQPWTFAIALLARTGIPRRAAALLGREQPTSTIVRTLRWPLDRARDVIERARA